MPEAGLFYLGAALGERALVALLRRLHEPAAGPAPALRPIGAEIAGLDREMLAAYRPPLSIDRHAEFVAAHSALQEARDLDAAGLRHGALLRYLQAALRFAPLRAAPASIERKLLAQQLASATAQLREDGRDHSLAAMLLEVADVELTTAAENAPTPAATAIAGDTLPRYLAAIGAAPERPAAVAPELTVTLVRWPYG